MGNHYGPDREMEAICEAQIASDGLADRRSPR